MTLVCGMSEISTITSACASSQAAKIKYVGPMGQEEWDT